MIDDGGGYGGDFHDSVVMMVPLILIMMRVHGPTLMILVWRQSLA